MKPRERKVEAALDRTKCLSVFVGF